MISIIIPTYNHATSLERAIKSVQNQTEKEIEIIIVNDGSTDNTKEVLKNFENKNNIKIITQKNQGSNPARNRGFLDSKGDKIMFLDADGILVNTALQKLKAALNTSNAAFAYSDFDFGGKKCKAGKFDETKLRENNYIHTSALINRKDFEGFDSKIKRFQDWDLWLTMLESGKKGIYVEETLMKFTIEYKGISTWMPKAFYKNPWKHLPWIKPRVAAYQKAKDIVKEKHKL